MKGSIRQRSPGSWELTTDLGRDAGGNRPYSSSSPNPAFGTSCSSPSLQATQTRVVSPQV